MLKPIQSATCRLPVRMTDGAIFGASAERARQEAAERAAREAKLFRFALVCVSVFAVVCGAVAGVAFR